MRKATLSQPDAFRTRSKKQQPFERARPYTAVNDSHARYYAMNDIKAPRTSTVIFKDDEGRRYRLGPVLPGGLQHLYVKLPKGVSWTARAGQTLTLYPPAKLSTEIVSPTLVYAFMGNDWLSRSGYIHVRGWWWNNPTV